MSPISATKPTAVSVVDAAKATQPGDCRCPRTLRGLLEQHRVKAIAARQQHFVMCEVLADEDQLDELIINADRAQPPQRAL